MVLDLYRDKKKHRHTVSKVTTTTEKGIQATIQTKQTLFSPQ
mgnify:CR=1 FL=1